MGLVVTTEGDRVSRRAVGPNMGGAGPNEEGALTRDKHGLAIDGHALYYCPLKYAAASYLEPKYSLNYDHHV